MRSSRLKRNILFEFLGQGLTLALSFVAARYVYRGLGGDALGIIYFSSTVHLLLRATLDLGICATTTREVAALAPAYVGATMVYAVPAWHLMRPQLRATLAGSMASVFDLLRPPAESGTRGV